ncbi:hypothetical protein AN639_03070 [Candidatus Epulonipiscium fishelsonii]|uniref:Uncharacterized protein n=1 Tax=Candidatus Epulonipiscium fishelsonii TaxID=77094 RepID=A0ACC8X9K9_9FIRM|nr:hypothetical protein AN396_01470 [Epulopiscium sp. SCG-B11WGA-EpuloA1]ONI41724.1 hypothetical protein AN639_03070 [Epulopiscium sp. SCG-B05WGA-EpuloA1]
MISATIYRIDNKIYRFKVVGHAGYGMNGFDIVCAGVSTLVFTTINSIHHFLNEPMKENKIDKKNGIIDYTFPNIKNGKYCEKTSLLLESMVLGLKSMEDMYGEYIKIEHKLK